MSIKWGHVCPSLKTYLLWPQCKSADAVLWPDADSDNHQIKLLFGQNWKVLRKPATAYFSRVPESSHLHTTIYCEFFPSIRYTRECERFEALKCWEGWNIWPKRSATGVSQKKKKKKPASKKPRTLALNLESLLEFTQHLTPHRFYRWTSHLYRSSYLNVCLQSV